jgi:hypothetical protein
MLGLASCQDVAERSAPAEGAAAEPGYPSLHTVPPRPQLSYTVEQRRAIVDGLIADRENARYSSAVVRYRAGLSSLPPPAAPSFAAVPAEARPEAPDAADAVTAPARDAPVVGPETQFQDQDDDLDSFMEEMLGDQIEAPGATGESGGEPEARAAPLDTRMIRAGAPRPIPAATAHAGGPPVVTLPMPPNPARLPVPRATETRLAGRAPGVVWGMPDMTMPPVEAEPPALTMREHGLRRAPSRSMAVETSLAERAPGVVWGMPDPAPTPAEPMPIMAEAPAEGGGRASPPALAPRETKLAGRAPGVVWGMPDLAPAPAGASAAAAPSNPADDIGIAHAAPLPRFRPAEAADTLLAAATADRVPHADGPRRAVPPAPAPIKPVPPIATPILLAGPAPEPVEATRTAMAQRPTDSPAVAARRRSRGVVPAGAAPPPAPPKPADDEVATADDAAAAAAGLAAAASVDRPVVQHAAVPQAATTALGIAGGLVDIGATWGRHPVAAVGSVAFHPDSALLAPDAVAHLGRLLATTAPEARIKIVGEADAPALALDRALAVGLALVQGGVPADRLELTLAHGGSGDRAQLFLAAPEL